jgi:hypothetical protein
VEDYISQKSGKDLSKIFDQYLRTTKIPVLEIDFGKETDKYIKVRWQNTVDEFNMPVKFSNGVWITPSSTWKNIDKKGWDWSDIVVDPNFYIQVKQVNKK